LLTSILSPRNINIRFEDMEEDIVVKTRFVLNRYAKYKRNFEEKKKLVKSEDIFSWGEEKGLLLSEIDEDEFYRFLRELTSFMQNIAGKI